MHHHLSTSPDQHRLSRGLQRHNITATRRLDVLLYNLDLLRPLPPPDASRASPNCSLESREMGSTSECRGGVLCDVCIFLVVLAVEYTC